jgi:hypothetical protein
MKAYFQCPVCKKPISTKVSGKDWGNRRFNPKKCPVQMFCMCRSDGKQTQMTFRGYGYDGRENWPHGKSK